jgi:hypothetical protein
MEEEQLSSISFAASAMSSVDGIWIKLNGDIQHLSKLMLLRHQTIRFLELLHGEQNRRKLRWNGNIVGLKTKFQTDQQSCRKIDRVADRQTNTV